VTDRLSSNRGEFKDRLVEKVRVKEDRERDKCITRTDGGKGRVLA